MELRWVAVLAAVALAATSGLLALVPGRRAGRWASPTLVAGALVGLAGAIAQLVAGGALDLALPFDWVFLPLALHLDGLAAFFLLPIFLVAAAAAIYGESYWPLAGGDGAVAAPRRTRLFFGVAVAGMALVVIAGSAAAFLVGWEAMAIAAFFLVGARGDDPEAREAAWIYLGTTHLGTLALFALFALLHRATGDWAIAALPPGIAATALGTTLFAAALFAFGLKAGVVPLHVWLPGAHAAAPSHVSALMSGVLLKIGIYGLFRFLLLVPDPPLAWGVALLALGALSSVLGVVFALGQHDLKRLLAYHSIENIGIIVLGLGVAMVGRATGNATLAALGLAGAALHVLNHALFKSLLFLGAGAVAHATGTRDLERLGGLARRMPLVATTFLAGAAAISALPPLNGFVSEWFLYLAAFAALAARGEAALAVVALAPLLALVGALALACFAKACGAVFLGAPRSTAARDAHAPGAAMTAPLVALALVCASIGLAPALAGRLLDAALAGQLPAGSSPLGSAAHLGPLNLAVVALAVILAAAGFALARRVRGARRAATWDCGYAAPSPRMQYTASSFAAPLTGYFRGLLAAREERPEISGTYPAPSAFHAPAPDLLLERFVLPAVRRLAHWTLYARYLQQGRLQVYLLYVGATLVVLLLLS